MSTVEHGGISIAYESRGTGTPALVLVHGWSCDRSYWNAQMDSLSREFQVVAVDLAGHGESGVARDAWTIPAFGEDVAAVVNDLRLEKVILVGHSMGGDVILEAARRLPGRVTGLVWVDVYRRIEPSSTPEEIGAFRAPFEADFVGATRAFVRRMFPSRSDPSLVARVALDMSSAPPEIALPALTAARSFDREVPRALRELKVPLIAINPATPPTDLSSMRRHGIEVEAMPDVGHFPMLEAPGPFNALLREVVARLTTRWDTPWNHSRERTVAMTAKTLEAAAELSQEAITALKARVRGPVFTSADAAYQESRTLWNGMIDRKPAVVVRPLGVADVIACVQFAREQGVLLSIKGGGHNIAGLAVADGAMMLDMSLMRGVWVRPKEKIAHAQAGCLLGDVDRETQLYGLAAVLGFVSLTGIAGLTLGGGFGYLTRRWGYTSDNVLGMDVVTADGKLVRASEDENPDLFWGLRGGGGNFGVVTGIDYKLYPVGPEIVGGIVAWPQSEAPRVLDLYRTMAEEAPPELTMVALLRPAPPAPWLPKETHGKPIVAILCCYSGKPEDGEKLVQPIKSFGKPVGDVLARRPYTQVQSMMDWTQPKGRRYYWKSEYLPAIEPSLNEKVVKHAAAIESPHSAVILFQMGGALNRIDEGHSAVGNRGARYVLNIAGSWEKAEEDRAGIEWAREAWNDMKSHSTGGTYLNFLNEDDGAERTRAALGSNLARLGEIKAKWDPENVFRTNRNIAPSPAR